MTVFSLYDPKLLEQTAVEGEVLIGFENVILRRLTPPLPLLPGGLTRVAVADKSGSWIDLVTRVCCQGFFIFMCI